jgi:hypothetical protein
MQCSECKQQRSDLNFDLKLAQTVDDIVISIWAKFQIIYAKCSFLAIF